MPRHLQIPVRKKPTFNLGNTQRPITKSSVNPQIENLLKKGLELHQVGNITEAQKIYQEILQTEPNHFQAIQLMGMAYLQSNQYQPAIQFLNKALQIDPKFPACHINRGIALQALQKYDEALLSYQEAIRLNPNYVEAYSNQGITLNTIKRYDEALASYDKAIDINPKYPDAYNNRGNTLHELKRYEEALASYENALALKPEYVDAYLNKGNTLQALKRYDEAIEAYERGIIFNPDYVELYYSIGNAAQELKRYGIALACYEKVISLRPEFIDAHLNRSVVLQKLKKYEDALANYDKTLKLNPNYVKALSNKGTVLKELKRLDEALANYEKAISIDPNYVMAHSNRGLLLLQKMDFQNAIISIKKVIDIDSNNDQAYYDLGAILYEQGNFYEAIKNYRKALDINKDHKPARDNILFTQSYTSLISPQKYLEEAKKFELAILEKLKNRQICNRKFNNNYLSDRRLKIGYISGDLYSHSVSYFIDEILRSHNHSKVEIFAYYTNSIKDYKTELLKTYVDHWISAHDMSHDELCDRIVSDSIDVLIDLSGFTAFNRMEVFARRAAPVQAHYLGFTGSTGLTEMDYWIGDPILTPHSIQHYFSEQLWQLPRVWVSYKGDSEVPTSKWAPAKDGSICLGSFNDLGKLTDATVELWAKTLKVLPQAYLLIKTKKLGDIGNRKRVLDKFNTYGISDHRIELQDYNTTPNWYAHMAYYDRMDIALDPFGAAGGGTTTCDALWMGVPIITLVKEDSPMASRMTASMLHAISHPEWIAHSETEYIEKVIALAKDVEYRKALRYKQREKMAKSPLCDAKGLARALEDAYEAMFNKWYQEKGASQALTSSTTASAA